MIHDNVKVNELENSSLKNDPNPNQYQKTRTDLRFVSLLAAPHGESAEEAVQLWVWILTFDAAEHVDQLLDVLGLLGERGGVAGLQTCLPVQVCRHDVALALQYWRCLSHISLAPLHLAVTRAEDDGIAGDLLVLLEVDDVTHLDGLALHLTVASLLDNSHNPLICSVIFFVSATFVTLQCFALI